MSDFNWWCHVPLLAIVAWAANWLAGPRFAVGASVLLATLWPSWYRGEILGEGVNLRVAAAFLGLSAYVFDRRSTYRTRFTYVDWPLLVLATAHFLSDTYVRGLSLSILLRIYGEWFLPYISGRVAVQSAADARQLRSVGTFVVLILVLLAVVEAVWRFNPWETFYGLRPLDQMPRMALRWGFRRAYGPTMHPIFLGMVLLLLLPWTAVANFGARSPQRSLGERLVGLMPWLVLAIAAVGIFLTGSRAPLLTLPLMLAVATAWRYPRTRTAWASLAVLLCGLAVWQFDAVVRAAQDSAGDRRIVAGERREITGSTGRFYLLKAYWPAMCEAGAVGFGSDAVAKFPVTVPTRIEALHEFKWLQFVDNHYVLLTLRFGWLGVAGLFGGIFAATWFWWREGADPSPTLLATAHSLASRPPLRTPPQDWMPGLAAACLLGVLVEFTTVWLSQDVAIPLLFLLGAASGQIAERDWQRRQTGKLNSDA